MKFTLMHKNIPVIDIDIDIHATGAITQLLTSYDLQHLPIGTYFTTSGIDRRALNYWWKGRSIPGNRDGLEEALSMLHTDAATLVEKSYGLSSQISIGFVQLVLR